MVLAAGVVQGVRTDRWRASSDLDAAVKRLDAVPATLGDWHGEKQTYDVQDLTRAGIKGHVSYRYRNVVTGDRVSMLIVCGRSGPISVHTPDICYGSAGFVAVGDKLQKEIPIDQDRTLQVWALRFKAPSTLASAPLEVNWAWNGGKGWIAPQTSRWTFSGYPVLYKLYAVRETSSLADQKRDPTVSFLQTFLPELEKLLAQ